MKAFFLTLVFILSIQSCKKTKLNGDLSVLVGTWEWRNTLYASNACESHPDTIVTHSPSLDGFTYTLNFLKKGKIEVYVNGKLDKKYRLIRTSITNNSNDIVFAFHLNNKKKYFSIKYYESNGSKYIESNALPLNILNGFDGCRVEYSVFEKVD